MYPHYFLQEFDLNTAFCGSAVCAGFTKVPLYAKETSGGFVAWTLWFDEPLMRCFEFLRLSIQSLLCANPLQNEPGHEHETGSDCDLYTATWAQTLSTFCAANRYVFAFVRVFQRNNLGIPVGTVLVLTVF